MATHSARNLGAVAAALMLAGCSGGGPDVLAMKIELNALKQELEYVRQQTEDLEPRVSTAEQLAIQVLDDRDAPLRLDCLRHAPAALPTRLAVLTVICEDTLTSADGVRIRLKLGNPTAARVDGVKLTFYAGEGAARGRSDKRLYHEAQVSLPPGSWTSLDVDFADLDERAAHDLALRADIGLIALAGK